MTEDDTFNALRREPFESVVAEIAGRSGTPDDMLITKSVWASGNENLDSHWIDFLRVRGWAIQDFEKECRRDIQEYKRTAKNDYHAKVSLETSKFIRIVP